MMMEAFSIIQVSEKNIEISKRSTNLPQKKNQWKIEALRAQEKGYKMVSRERTDKSKLTCPNIPHFQKNF